MRKILILALAAPLFAACTPADNAGSGATVSGTMGEGRPTIERGATRANENAGSGAAAVTGTMGEGRPTIETAPARGRGIASPGTPVVTETMGEGRPTIERR